MSSGGRTLTKMDSVTVVFSGCTLSVLVKKPCPRANFGFAETVMPEYPETSVFLLIFDYE